MLNRNLILILFAVVILVGCAGKTIIPQTTVIKKSQIAKVDVLGINKWIFLNITNLTDDVIEIDWIRSSLSGSALVTDVQRVSTVNTTIVPATVLGPKKMLAVKVYDARKISSFGYMTDDLILPTQLIIHLKNGKEEDNLVVDIEQLINTK